MNDDERAVEDEDERWDETIRAKWSMDGAQTLEEAAAKLRDYAAWLEELRRDGWELTGPVTDDYGFIVNEDPKKRLSVRIL